MIALFLAPIYILINLYVIRWIFLWMGACHQIFQSFIFRAAFTGIYIFFSTSLLTGFLIKKPYLLHRFLKIVGNYFLGTFLYILLVIFIVDAARIILRCLFHTPWLYSRRTFIIMGFVCTLSIIGISFYGILHAWNLKTTSYTVSVKKQVEQMDSLKIVLIADLHLGYSIGRLHVKQMVEQINQEDPDLVCIAGDIFDNEYDALRYPEEVQTYLQSIKSKYGVYACWGNHDLNEPILAGFTFGKSQDHHDPRMEEFLKGAGIRLLDDESVLIDDKFYLVGRKDLDRSKKLSEQRKTPAQLTEKLDKSKPVIFIDHQPKDLEEAADAGVDLDLCGHTHNGQIFPGNLVIPFFWENPCGYIQKENLHNIVTSGVGVWGPNMRVGTDSEICSITVEFE